MAVFRVGKNNNYTTMCNHHLKDKNLTLKAKGLLSMMLSLPDSWKYSINGLCAICKENETSIKSTLKELEENSYLTRKKTKNNLGHFEWLYTIYEVPVQNEQKTDSKIVELPQVGFPPMDNPPIDNHPIYKDTNLSNTKELNTNLKNDKEFTQKNSQEPMINRKEFANANVRYFLDYFNSRSDMQNKFTMIKKSYIDFLSTMIEVHSLSVTEMQIIVDYYIDKYKARKNKSIYLLLTEKVFNVILTKLNIIAPEEAFDETGNYNI